MSYNLPCPSLAGILLVVSTHNGPQFTYHYPPELANHTLLSLSRRTNNDQNDDDDDDDDGELDEGPVLESTWNTAHPDYYLGTKQDLFTFLDAQQKNRIEHTPLLLNENLPSLKRVKSTGKSSLKQVVSNLSRNSATAPAESSTQILGFEPEYLSEVLCPQRQMCNGRFEIMIENAVFLGLPIHVYDNGSWRSKKLKHKSESKHPNGAEGDSGLDTDSSNKNSMSMFHLVFVLNPPEIERNYRIDEMFFYVISKLSLVLRYEQLKHEYVWNQVKLISKLKEEWRTQPSAELESMSDHLISKSSLCKLMADCYDAISTSRIANLSINNKLRSFQIPIKTEFYSMPEATVPYIPGSYLSSTVNLLGSSGLISVGETSRYNTSTLMNLLLNGHLGSGDLEHLDEIDDELENGDEKSSLDDVIHFSLLLLDDPDTIIRDIKAETHTTLANFVRMIKPTESLVKITNKLKQQSGEKLPLEIEHVKSFALHLIYWRRARIIPPLNSRSIYIVSPMAPITSNFHTDIAKFKLEFATVPSLPLFLKLLSSRSKKPRQFATIIPSRDHKDIYLSALAWLIRYGYVTQLHTYIWLKVPRKVKMKVEEDLENELGRIPKRKTDAEYSSSRTPVTDNKVSSGSVDNSSKQNGNGSKRLERRSETIDDDIDNIQKRFEMASVAPNIVLEDDGDTILVDPGRASSLERRWINKIIHDECNLSPELTTIFYKLLKYMNGKNSLELLLLKENISRTELRKLLVAVEDYIISVRHW